MDKYILITKKILKEANILLNQSASLHIYSFPTFILEAFLAILVCIIYILLHFEITDMGYRTLRSKANTLFFKPLQESYSKESYTTSITHYQCSMCKAERRKPSTTVLMRKLSSHNSNSSQIGWILPNYQDGDFNPFLSVSPEATRYTEGILSLTPTQFVKLDKERKIRERRFRTYMTSLTTLCNNVLEQKYSNTTLKRQIEMARENVECSKMSNVNKYIGFETEAMTKSLFELLERIVTNSSLESPLPFKGDITTLALDAADIGNSFERGDRKLFVKTETPVIDQNCKMDWSEQRKHINTESTLTSLNSFA